MIERIFLCVILISFSQTENHIPIGKNYSAIIFNYRVGISLEGWFVDEKTSNDVDIHAFSSALSSAMDITDGHLWPKNRYTFRSIYDNVSVSINFVIYLKIL